MNRRGAALLMALWFLVAVTGLAMATIGSARLGLAESGNRITATQGRWAAEACLSLFRAGYQAGRRLGSLDSIPLGEDLWCRLQVEDPGASLNINAADRRQWRLLLGDEALAAAVVDWIDADDRMEPLGAEREWYRARGLRPPRNAPLASVEQLLEVRGMTEERLALIRPFLTVRGDGRITLNSAPVEVLALVPGIDLDFARLLVADRERGDTLIGLDDLVGRATGESRAALESEYFRISQTVRATPERLVLHSEGHIGTRPPSELIVTVVPVAGRVAIVGKEAW